MSDSMPAPLRSRLVTVDEMLKYLEKEIPNQARKIGKTDKEKESQAVPIGSRTSHFVITKNPAETDFTVSGSSAVATARSSSPAPCPATGMTASSAWRRI